MSDLDLQDIMSKIELCHRHQSITPNITQKNNERSFETAIGFIAKWAVSQATKAWEILLLTGAMSDEDLQDLMDQIELSKAPNYPSK